MILRNSIDLIFLSKRRCWPLLLLGLNRTEFSQYIGIPLRTLEEWEAGRRQMPEYVLRLISYYTKMQQVLAEKNIEIEVNEDAEE